MNYFTKTFRKGSLYWSFLSHLFLIILFQFDGIPFVRAQVPVKQWDKTYGGSAVDDFRSHIKTIDGGFLLGGNSTSNLSGDKSQNSKGGNDYWIVKLDGLGNKIWDKTYGGTGTEFFVSMINTTDGGFLVWGHSESNMSGDKSENSRGGFDWWIIKLDALGNKIWDKTIGGNNFDYLSSVLQSPDGGYYLAGYSSSAVSGEKSQNSKGANDGWLVRLDALGNKIWDKTLGGSSDDYFRSIVQAWDGGFVIGALSSSNISGDKSENSRGSSDYWLVKVDPLGNKVWDKTYGGSDGEGLERECLIKTSDGGYVFGGYSSSNFSGDKTENSRGTLDYWVVKVDGSGFKIWDKTFGGSQLEWFYSIIQTTDGGYLIGGFSNSGINGDKTENSRGGNDYWIVKLNSTGLKSWDKTYGGSSSDQLFTISHASDGGYLLGGASGSNANVDKTQNSKGLGDYWIIKLGPESTPADTIAPDILNLPDTVYVSNDPGFCSAQVTWLDPEVTDEGGVALIQSDYSSGDTFPVGITIVTYTAQDSSGNTAMASLVIVVSDNEAPVVATQNITIYLNDSGYAMITPMDIDLGSTDNCGIGSLQLSNTYFDIHSPDYDSVNLTVTDIHGNQATLGAVVTVIKPDTTAPVINLSMDTIYVNNDPDLCSAQVFWLDPEVTDEGGVALIQSDYGSGDSFPIGATTVTYTAQDSSGNTAMASFLIVVSDNEYPLVMTRDITVYLNDSGVAYITEMDIENGSSDNCGITEYELSKYQFDCSGPGQDTVVLTITDIHGNENSASASVTVLDTLVPVWSTTAGSLDRTLICGNVNELAEAQSLSPEAGDNCGYVTYVKTSGNLMGNTYTNTWVAQDAWGNVSELFTQLITITPLSIDASASSNPVPVGSAALLSATVTPAEEGIEVQFYIDEVLVGSDVTSASGIIEWTVHDLSAGVHKIKTVVRDGCTESIAYLPVYDPEGGFVTGGGWIQSPTGAYTAEPSLTGKANFGFVSKYKKGSNEVDGNTEFRFQAGNLNFKSSSHTAASLVIAGAKAIYKGVGTVNGAGNYGFMVSAIDGQINGGGNADKFRIKIWDKNIGNEMIYDNQLGTDENADATTLLGGGSIVIHKPKNGENLGYSTQGTGLKINASYSIKLEAYPNPMQNQLNLRIDNPENHPVKIDLIHITGRLMPFKVREVSNQFYQLDVSDLPVGVYSLQVKAGHSLHFLKVLKQE